MFMFAGIAALAAACGNDAKATVDAGSACTGHACPDGGSGSGVAITDPEGGNVIFENIYFDTELQAAFGLPTGVTTANRVMAYFMNSQTPNSNPLPMAGQCNNLESTKGWPLFVGTPHVDLDVGTLTITGKNAAGTDVNSVIPKKTASLDAIGRMHDTYYQVVNPDTTMFVKPDSLYSVKFGGAGTVPATTMTDAIFMPANFTVTMPDIENNGPLVAGTDFTVKWNPATSTNTPTDLIGGAVLGVTWLVDTNGKPTHMCPVAHSSGTFTIPGATITEYKAIATARGAVPSKVILLRNAIAHRLQRLPNGDATNKRRIDMLAVNCWAQLMDVQ